MIGWMVLIASIAVTGAPEPGEPIDLLASMDLWERDGGAAESFTLEDGILRAHWTRHEPAHLITRADYENFELSFECKVDEWGETGLYIHAPRNGAYRAGLQLDLSNFYGGAVSEHSSNSIFREVAPRAIPMKSAGEWNAVRVRMDWPHLRVHINDECVHDLDLSEHPELKYKLRRGAIGFQNLGWGLEVRDMVLRPLPDTENAISLFNGKDLTGWTVDGGRATWDVHEGAIRCSGHGYLKHERLDEDFDLRLYLRTSPAANGGIYFRWLAMEPFGDRGHEIQVLDVPDAIMPTGSIYGIERGNDLLITPGEWQLLQLFVRGREAVVYLNGVRSCSTDRLGHVRPGHICLQAHRGGTWIDHKEIHLVPADAQRQP
jgi:hypothetical protein